MGLKEATISLLWGPYIYHKSTWSLRVGSRRGCAAKGASTNEAPWIPWNMLETPMGKPINHDPKLTLRPMYPYGTYIDPKVMIW